MGSDQMDGLRYSIFLFLFFFFKKKTRGIQYLSARYLRLLGELIDYSVGQSVGRLVS